MNNEVIADGREDIEPPEVGGIALKIDGSVIMVGLSSKYIGVLIDSGKNIGEGSGLISLCGINSTASGVSTCHASEASAIAGRICVWIEIICVPGSTIHASSKALVKSCTVGKRSDGFLASAFDTTSLIAGGIVATFSESSGGGHCICCSAIS